MKSACTCQVHPQSPKLVVLTGGPGAGKTAVLEIIVKNFCQHVLVLPEAASIVYGGGFWRKPSIPAQQASQRAIFHVQTELERLVLEERQAALALCDRGTVDGLAYWPADEASYWTQLNTTRKAELAKYAAVIHLRTPPISQGYNHSNPVRIESAEQAAEIDRKIEKAWDGHPKRSFVESSGNFLEKVGRAIELVWNEVPECCRHGASSPWL